MPDRVIRNAMVFDGTGAPPRTADVTIAGERIVDVGRAPGGQGPGDVDAHGLALAPGFIDVHTHDDFAVVVHPEMGFKVQGSVTTVVVGNCGFGAAPWPVAQGMARTLHPGRAVPAWDGFAGYLADAEEITLEKFRHRPWFDRVDESAAMLLARVL